MRTILYLWLAGVTTGRVTTQYVNDVEPLLRANRDAYLAGPHTPERQAAAIQVFDQWWLWLHSSAGCSNDMLADSGIACLQDRARDGRWPWEVYYLDPIVNAR